MAHLKEGSITSYRIWDVRKLDGLALGKKGKTMKDAGDKTVTVEYDYDAVTSFLDSKSGKACLRGEWAHNKSVSSAYWDPRGRSIVSTSYDDTLRRKFR